MRLSRSMAIFLLGATVIPLAYMALLFISMLLLGALGLVVPYFVLSEFYVLFVLWSWGLIAFYLVYLFRTDVVPRDKRALWAVVLILANLLATPFFWYHYMRPEAPLPTRPGGLA